MNQKQGLLTSFMNPGGIAMLLLPKMEEIFI